jgi:hypothetical protein
VIFLIKDADGFIFACTGYSDDRTSAEDLSAGSSVSRVICTGGAGGRRMTATLVGRDLGCIVASIFI